MIDIKRFRLFVLERLNTGVLLFIASILAILLANSPWREWYEEALALSVNVQLGDFSLFMHEGEPMTLFMFVNDALMAIFFLVVGLEIKEELLVGELSTVRKAILPIIAAIGGMIVPVLLFFLICHRMPEARGAAIPMATDIAFSLAVLRLFGRRLPVGVKIFMTALAIVDDIGGVIVIVLFYSGSIAWLPLLAAVGLVVFIYFCGRLKIACVPLYYLGGVVVWFLLFESAVHPTIAGVMLAFAVPASPFTRPKDFKREVKNYLSVFDSTKVRHGAHIELLTSEQVQVLNKIHLVANGAISPLQRMVIQLGPLVGYLILPLFAFVNAGIHFEGLHPSELLGVPLAIVVGLFVGKTVGIYLFTTLAAKLGLVSMTSGITKGVLLGVSILGGIGFTVSLFIANLAYDSSVAEGALLLNQAKLGILVGSILSGLVGFLYLNRMLPQETK